MRMHADFLKCGAGDFISLRFDDEKSSHSIRVENIDDARMLLINIGAAINEWVRARSDADPYDQTDRQWETVAGDF